MLVNVTLSLMGGFNVFDIPYVMTEGGPANSTMVMALHIYIRGLQILQIRLFGGHVLCAIGLSHGHRRRSR